MSKHMVEPSKGMMELLEKPAESPTVDGEPTISDASLYRVFNLDQVTGIKKPALEKLPTFQPVKETEEVATKYQEQIEVRLLTG
jgi:hypothetical protein